MLNHPIARLLAPIFAAACFAAPASAQTLLINEVDYDQIGTDTAEFIEILNVSGSSINLADYTLYLVNGANNSLYLTMPLASAGTIAPGQYLLVCSNTVTVPGGVLFKRFTPASDNVQNGAPDGIALVNTVTNTMADSLSYEGAMTNVTVIPNLGPVSLVHGTALPITTADSNTVVRSLCRVPSGATTGNDIADWALLDTPTPGAANPSPCTPDAPATSPEAAQGCPGATATFTVTMPPASTQAPFTYSWRRNGTPVTLDARITSTPAGDSLSCTLSVSGLILTDAGDYDAVVTGTCGAATPSAAAHLFVAPADVGVQGGTAGQDGLYDNNDFVVFIQAFFDSLPAGDLGEQGGTFGPDGLWDNNDFVVFIEFFFTGCPPV